MFHYTDTVSARRLLVMRVLLQQITGTTAKKSLASPAKVAQTLQHFTVLSRGISRLP